MRKVREADLTQLFQLKARLDQLAQQSGNLPFIFRRVELQLLDLRRVPSFAT
jgi:hypothetical protein